MATDDEIDGRMLEQFREKAPDLLPLALTYTAGACERWHISGVAPGPGWWGEGDGFFLDVRGNHPGLEACDLRIWVGLDHAHIQVLLDWDGEWRLDSDWRMEHGNLRAYLDSLPKPFWAYGVEEIESE